MANKYSYTAVKQICKDGGFSLVDEVYISSSTKMKMICDTCGFIRETKLSHVISGHGCAKCNGCGKYSNKEVLDILEKKNIATVEIEYKYKSIHKKIDLICLVCEYKWSPSFNSILRGSGCPSCSGKAKYTIEEARKIVNNNGGKLITTTYKNVYTKLDVICNICNTEWTPTFRSLYRGHWCPTCADIKGGKKQKLLVSILEEIFPKEDVFSNFKGFDWLVYKKRQEVDIWIPHIKLAIEYDGKQHFEPIKYFGGESVFIEQQKRDKNKDKLIKEHSDDICHFIRFNYKDVISRDKVEALLIAKNIINCPS